MLCIRTDKTKTVTVKPLTIDEAATTVSGGLTWTVLDTPSRLTLTVAGDTLSALVTPASAGKCRLRITTTTGGALVRMIDVEVIDATEKHFVVEAQGNMLTDTL